MLDLRSTAERTFFHGVIPPLITPLRQPDQLDLQGLERLVDHMIVGGVHGLFILGTTGEGPSHEYVLRRELVQRVCQQAGLRIPVVVGISDTSPAESIRLADHAHGAGASAVVLAAPYYSWVSQIELAQYAESIAKESPLPLLLYNIPSLTKVRFEIDTVRTLMEEENIVGIKDSSGDMSYFHRLLSLDQQREDWSVLMGPEELMAESVLMGGHGGVCGGANVFPELFVELYDAARSKNVDRVRALQSSVVRLGTVYRLRSDGPTVIQGIKAALKHLGICSDFPASPSSRLADSKVAYVRQVVDELMQRTTAASSKSANNTRPASSKLTTP